MDYSVYYSISPSIRIDAHTSLNPYREVDNFGGNFNVNPGDHVIFRCWVKTGSSTLGQNGVANNGAILNWDWYGSGGRLHDHSSNNPYYDQTTASAQAVGDSVGLPFNRDWTQLALDCIVPNQVYNDNTGGFSVPTYIVLAPCVSWYNPSLGGQIDDGQAWYSNAELYINPSGSSPVPSNTPTLPPPTSTPPPIPTPTPSGTPTPTPSGSPTPTPTPSPSTGFIIQTTQNFNLAYDSGEGFKVQDVAQNILVTFTVESGALNGLGNLNVTSSGGLFLISPTTSGTLEATANIANFYVTVNGVPAGLISYTAGTSYLVMWTYLAPPAPPPIIVGTSHSVLYFRSDSYTSNNVTAYGLDITNTNAVQTITDSITTEDVTYGFRVWVLHPTGTLTELTSGLPDIQVTRDTDGTGWQNTTWLCPSTTLNIGTDSLQVGLYLSLDDGYTWTARTLYITHPLLTTALLHQTWTFNLYTTRNETLGTCSYSFGSRTYNSNINGVGMEPPTQTQIQTYYFLTGNYILFILNTYTSEIGAAAYLLFLLIPTVTLYLRHRNFGPVVVFFLLFGGPGGLVWLLVPAWAAAGLDILLVLGAGFIVWKLIR